MPEGAVPAPEPENLDMDVDAIPWPVGKCRPGHPATDPERLRQRAVFLRELAEARALLARATPWRTRVIRIRARLRQATFRT
ncbi:MAG TPA: hypothetical protein VF082_01470 [Jiangellaceae bacterium]